MSGTPFRQAQNPSGGMRSPRLKDTLSMHHISLRQATFHLPPSHPSSSWSSIFIQPPLPLQEKLECWWLYVVDRRFKKMIVPPQRILGLRDEQIVRQSPYTMNCHLSDPPHPPSQVDLKFQAPDMTTTLRYTVILMSDSYLDLCFQRELKVSWSSSLQRDCVSLCCHLP